MSPDGTRVSDQPDFVPLPADGVYTAEWLNGLFGGNQQVFAYHLYSLTNAAGATSTAGPGEPLAASQPRRPSTERHLHSTPKQEANDRARRSV